MPVLRRALLAVALFPLLVAAQYDKPPEKWSYEEAYRILTDSPWAPAKSALAVTFEHQTVNRSPYSDVPSRDRTDRQQGVIASRIHPAGRTALPAITVLWRSARTLRLAQQRVAQFRGIIPKDAPLTAPALDRIVIVVEGSEPLRILSDAGEALHQTVYLELTGGRTIEPAEIKFVEGDRAGEDYVAFGFPREHNGEPTVTPNSSSAVFVCKAVSLKPAAGRPNSLALRVTFHPNKMRANDQPDF